MSHALLAVALVASGALAFEVLLTRWLAIVHWHHFASTVISLALLGYGASGSALVLLHGRLARHTELAFAACATLFGMAALGSVAIAQHLPFNALELIWNPRQGLWLGLLYLLFAVPFFFAAGCTGLALTALPAPVGRIYRSDLIGAGAGALAGAALLGILRPDRALPLVAAFGPLAGAVMLARAHRRLATVAALVTALLLCLAGLGWPTLRMSPFKPLAQTLRVAGTKVVAELPSPTGLVQVVASDRIPLRVVSGLSLMNRQPPAPQLGLFIDGEGPAAITRFTGDWEPLRYLDDTLPALVYRLLDRPRVLLLGLGGGTDLLLALRHRAALVDIVEPDATIPELLSSDLGTYSGRILDRPEVQLHISGGRRFVTATRSTFDLVMLDPTAYANGALAEGFATTVEAFAAYLRRLAPDGILALPHPLRLPPRDSLKLALTALGALEAVGAAAPSRHLVLLRSWDSALLLVRRSPWRAEDLALIEGFAAALAFDLGWHPTMQRDAADRFNLLGEPVFFDGMAAITGPRRAAFVAAQAFDLRPATDDRPFFADFFRWRALPMLWTAAREGSAGLLDWAWPVQLVTLGIAVLLSLALILLPVLPTVARRHGPSLAPTGSYFLLIGLGFLFTEIAFMQRAVLLLGVPVHAFAVTIAAFLVFAGLGSGVATRFRQAEAGHGNWLVLRPEIILLAIAGGGVLYLLAAPSLLALTADLGTIARTLLVGSLIAPLAFAMGMPFPLVLARLRTQAPALVPWAWAVNGCASVIAAILATVIVMSFGNRVLTIMAASAYAAAAWALIANIRDLTVTED